MMHQSYRHRGGKSSSAWLGMVFAVFAVVVGAYVVYQLIGWFRASSTETVAAVQASADGIVETSAPMIVDGSATLALADGGSAGVVYRRGTNERAEYNTVLRLPALAAGTAYEMWMVKEGLADVQTAGVLDVRADGTFTKVFSVVDPAEFTTIVIMLEPTDGVVTPSGNIVAQGSF